MVAVAAMMVMAVATRGMEIAVRAGAEMVEALGKVGAAPAPAEAPGPVLVPVQVPASEHVLVMALMMLIMLTMIMTKMMTMMIMPGLIE